MNSAQVQVFKKPSALKEAPFRFCPGCGHGTLHRIIAGVIEELGVRDRVIGIAPVGCAVFAYDYFDFDIIECAHGRPPAVATALKRVNPDSIVFSYQGDGDLAAIGTAEIIHAAARGENLSVFFVNNATYGMTGGQMAPTTIRGQWTSTTPQGRDSGTPLPVSEIFSVIPSVAYVERTALDSAANIKKTRNAVMKAFRYQMEGKGFSFVEVLSPCPTDWKMTPSASLKWMRSDMMKAFPLGVFRDIEKSEETGKKC